MKLFDKIDRHARLMNRMAETVHVDLSDALARGRLSSQDLRNAVMACVGCEGGADCPEWLTQHAPGAADTPVYCRNRTLFHRIGAQIPVR